MSGFAGMGPAVRIARRDALRHRARSVLIIALIALPVLAFATVDVVIRSATGSPAEQAALILGRADRGAAQAWIQAPAGAARAEQYSATDSTPTFYAPNTEDQVMAAQSAVLRPAGQVLQLLPPGAQLTPWMAADIPAKGPGGHFFRASVELVDLRESAAAGRFRTVAGVAATQPHQVALTTSLADRMDAHVGTTVTLGAPAAAFTVVGLLESLVPSDKPGERSVAVAMPGQIPVLGNIYSPGYLMSGASLNWAAVQALNGKGVGVYSRAAITDPDGFLPSADADSRALVVGAVILGVLMAVLQVVFLAGPAFAVGARRVRRQLGQLGAAGATPRQIRMVVLAGGLVLGGAGSLLGVTAGTALGLATNGFFVDQIGIPYVATHVVVSDLVVIFAIGLISAVLAALFPAISASRANLVSMLSRTPGTVATARWWSVAGVVTAAVGIAVTVGAASVRVSEAQREDGSISRAVLIAGGLLLVAIGLVLATPLILQMIARIGRSLPTTARLAVRDVARHQGRSAPAVAAVMTVTAVAVTVTSLFATMQTSKDFGYHPSRPVGSVMVSIDAPITTVKQIAALASVVGRTWPTAKSVQFTQPVPDKADQTVDPVVPKPNQCPWSMPTGGMVYSDSQASTRLPAGPELAAARTDWRCAGADYSDVTDSSAGIHSEIHYGTTLGVVIGGPDVRRLVTGIDDPAADEVLRQGGTVLLDRRFAGADGTFTLQMSHYDTTAGTGVVDRTITLPSVMGRWSETSATAVVSKSAARRAGLPQVTRGMIVGTGPAAADRDVDTVTMDLAAAGVPAYADVETGSAPLREQPSPWLILSLAAILIALTIAVVTALSVADARDDLSTLAAVGAPGWMRRRFSGWSALVVAAVGCLLGGLLGLVPAYGLTRLIYQTGGFTKPFFEVPWIPVLTVICALPVLAFLVATATTRSKINVMSRAA